jgi:PAS domain S-box-containing protein
MKAADYETRDAEMLAINEKLVIAAIRQQEHAEVAQRAEQRLRDMVQGLDAVICEVDMRTGQPSFLSLNAETFLGHSRDHWLAQPDFVAKIVHPRDRTRVTALFPAFLRAGQDYEYEFRALSSDTEQIWMRNRVRLVYDADGNLDLLRCIIVDVTTEKQTAQALEALYAHEHHITEVLQRALLFMPPEDSFPGLAVKTLYEAASDQALVGGDFWDTFACDHGNVAFILGDVMGHGLPAAIFTAELKYALRGFIREHVYPGRIMNQMNAYLCESQRLYLEGLNAEGDDAPVCLTLIIINTDTGKGAVAAAGMEPPLLVHSDGKMEEMEVRGLLLGIDLETEYEEATFQLAPGDMVIMTTDGVTEARHGKQFLGYEGLIRLAEEGRSLGTLDALGQTILAGARAFASGKLKDDACVLLVRRQ